MNTAVRFRASSLAVLIGSVITAQGALIDFEGLSGGAPQSGGTYLTYSSPLAVGDYVFETPTRFSLPTDFGVWTDIADANTSFSNYTGSIALFSNTAAPTTMTRSDGGLFDVSSIDIANIYRNQGAFTTARFTGNLSGGGTVIQDFTTPTNRSLNTVTLLGFAGLTSFVISDPSTGSALNPYQFDNISVQAVPEPASMAAIAVGAIAWVRRRRKA